MKTRYLALLLSVLLVPALATPAAAQTADEIIVKHLEAMGGREALGKLTSRRGTGMITLSTPNGDLSGPIEIFAKPPNKGRAHITLDLSALGVNDTMIIDQIFDGATGWALNSLQGDAEITGDQLQSMKNNVFPTPLLTYKELGTTFEMLPEETIAGKPVFVLLGKPKVGAPTKMFVDKESYFVVRTITTINVPEAGGDLVQTAEASDYRTVDGVKVPFLTVNSTPVQTATIKLDTVVHNEPIDDAMFVKSAVPYLMMILTSNLR